jgi:hypothetical protein
MPLPIDAELPAIYPTNTPGNQNDSDAARWECRKEGIGPDLSALRLRSLIQYARQCGLTNLDQSLTSLLPSGAGRILKRSGQQMGTAISAGQPTFARPAETT